MWPQLEWLIENCRVAASMAVNALVEGGYGDLAGAEAQGRFSSEQLEGIVSAFGGDLVEPPEEVFRRLHVVPEPGSDPLVLHAALRLWTKHEGRSQLVIRFRFTDLQIDPGVVRCEITSLGSEGPGHAVWPPPS